MDIKLLDSLDGSDFFMTESYIKYYYCIIIIIMVICQKADK